MNEVESNPLHTDLKEKKEIFFSPGGKRNLILVEYFLVRSDSPI